MDTKFTRKESLSLLKKLDIEVCTQNLIYQAQEGGLTEVKHLVNAGIDVKSIFEGRTALISSSRKGHIEVVKFLLKEGANSSVLDNEKCDALYYAVIGGHVEVANYLLESGANPNGTPGIALSPIRGAIETGNKELIKLLLDFKADLSIKSDDKYNLLIRSSEKGLIDVVEFLLSQDANPNLVDEDKKDALSAASYGGYSEIVKLLLDNGANINGNKNSSYPPIVAAAGNNQIDIIELLIKKGADINIKDEDGNTAIKLSHIEGHEEAYNKLIELGATPLTEEEMKRESNLKTVLKILKLVYHKNNYIFLAINIFCFIIIFFVLNEKTGGGIFARIFTFLFCTIIGGLLGVWGSRKESDAIVKGFKRGAGTLLVFSTLIFWSNNNYTPSHSSSYSTSKSHTCTQCGRSYKGAGWTTVGGEQYQPSSDPGYDQCCSKSCAYDSQPSNWK